ncbi:hypothetical protein AXX12_14030 [Anaerosporomusa subterranea]|uniref:Inverse autotransporter beta-domain domain-containing protein n=1 Tax=Anaerosporomusa subterranea TaxID=1794912 RepID=A0A154BMQ9_ANASB|nr:carboxypeptidase regulatory-like domain-containing protein [Anaerosporomusa subterranea]KYZ75273.1 hypothetical protein AXX12_14030 [Anaerosporomusa subterranea]
MILVRQVQKNLTNILVWLLVLTNLVLPTAQAANTAEKTAVTQEQAASQDATIVLKLDKSQTPQTVLVPRKIEASSKNKTTDQDKMFQFGNQLLSYYLQEGKSEGPEWLKTTTLNFYISEDFKPTYSLETIQPFGERNNNPGDHWFWQGRYARSEDASTFNFGLGWRNLAPDRQSLLGMNLFYDYGFKYNLARIGLGGEYFNKLSEYRFNVYHPITGDKLANVNYQNNGILYSYIRAVDGVDFELGTSFTHARWLKAFVKGYYYDNKHKDDERGYQLRTTMQFSPRFNLELGYRCSNLNHDPYALITYQLADTMAMSRNKGQAKEDGPYDLSDKLLQLVERENDIKTETWTKFVAYRGSIKTTVTNSHSNTAIVGATVQAYQNGAAVGTAVVTDNSGIATISGLAVGSYTVNVTYGSYGKTNDAIMVAKDTTVPANVSLDVVSGGAKVTVLDAHSVGISGATVVATESSSPTSSFSVSMTTNANGFATFTNLPPGTYTFTAAYQGNSMASEAVSITAGKTSDVTILLPTSGGNIRAVVTDDSGTVLGGATVKVLSGTTTVATGTTGTNGVAIIGGIAAGSYTVSASLADYTASSTSSVEISEGKTSTSGLILTRQRGTLTVTLKDSAGTLLANTSYSLSVSGTTYTGITDASGQALVNNIATSATSVIASVTGYNDTSGTITWTGTTGIATITLAGNGSTSSTFTVVDEKGDYLGGATVSLTDGGTTLTQPTADDGKVTINGLTSGIAYSYTVTMPGTSSTSGTISAGQSKTARLTANSGNYFFITISDNSVNATYIQFTCSGYSVRVPLTPNMNMRYTTNIMPTATYQITSNVGTCTPSTRQIGSGNPVTISIN